MFLNKNIFEHLVYMLINVLFSTAISIQHFEIINIFNKT